jgi:hypothetical protein
LSQNPCAQAHTQLQFPGLAAIASKPHNRLLCGIIGPPSRPGITRRLLVGPEDERKAVLATFPH